VQLIEARIQNFRSLRDVAVTFDAHTAFIGGNGAGKSSILKALEKFYSTSKALEPDDYFGRDTSLTVEIELTFGHLTEEEHDTFDSRIRDDKLIVTRVFDNSSASGRYFGSVPQNPDFSPIRRLLRRANGTLPTATCVQLTMHIQIFLLRLAHRRQRNSSSSGRRTIQKLSL
jgi:energy-coupling factor transporter ATP-binding protein EcfA2